jgi:pyridoxal phosphate enzyme (YggS family)
MDPCNAVGFVNHLQATKTREPADPAQQPLALARRQVMVPDHYAASAREPRDPAQQVWPEPLVGNQPLARGAGLAALHRPSYSAFVTAAERLDVVRETIAAAARLARREPANVTLIAVSKTRSPEEIKALVEAGQHDFGESRVQEALAKWPQLLDRHPALRLHCIGRLQSNKAAEAVELFASIHSLDRLSLLEALARQAEKVARFPSVFVQVNIGEEEQKGGCTIAEVGKLVEAVRQSPLPLAGLMAVPPLGVEPSPYFALLAKLAAEHGVSGLSMGMSGDYRRAVMLGATAVRVGTALFED